MKRGEVWWVRFGPAIGGEIRKERPAVIVSNDVANRLLNRLQVVPLSSQVQDFYPSEVAVTLRGKPHKAMADQLTTVSKLRVRNRMGRLSTVDLQAVQQVIKLHLDLT
jgi:mRNA interferase MazF